MRHVPGLMGMTLQVIGYVIRADLSEERRRRGVEDGRMIGCGAVTLGWQMGRLGGIDGGIGSQSRAEWISDGARR